ncbi:MAG: hypothetical protein GY714_09145 [Desulfobacterales bacterium]|nr:hypothetical protein [Desulfobacterales bacterium]
MPTLEEIKKQIQEISGPILTLGTKKEIQYLPEILNEGETVLGLTSGLMNANTWLIVCTQKRVIFLDKGWIYGLEQFEIPLNKINSIKQKTGLFVGEICIQDGQGGVEIKNVLKKTVKYFVSVVSNAIDGKFKANDEKINQSESNYQKCVSSGNKISNQFSSPDKINETEFNDIDETISNLKTFREKLPEIRNSKYINENDDLSEAANCFEISLHTFLHEIENKELQIL